MARYSGRQCQRSRTGAPDGAVDRWKFVANFNKGYSLNLTICHRYWWHQNQHYYCMTISLNTRRHAVRYCGQQLQQGCAGVPGNAADRRRLVDSKIKLIVSKLTVWTEANRKIMPAPAQGMRQLHCIKCKAVRRSKWATILIHCPRRHYDPWEALKNCMQFGLMVTKQQSPKINI